MTSDRPIPGPRRATEPPPPGTRAPEPGGPGTAPGAAPPGQPFWRGRAELALAALLALLGVYLLVETRRIEVPATANAVGPRFFPTAVGLLLVVAGIWLAADVLRGGRGDPEVEEDVDLSRPSDWRTLALLTAAFFAHVLLLEPVGWVVAGFVLFWGVAFALGSRRYPRDAAIAAVLAVLVYVVFARGLGVSLPAGVLEGVL